MDTNNFFSGTYTAPLELIGYIALTNVSGQPWPVGTQVGDIAIHHDTDHDNGTTTTPGATSAGYATGFTPISSDGSAAGSDEIDSSLAFKILDATDIVSGVMPSGGCSGGDQFASTVYILRIKRPLVSSLTPVAVNMLAENTEGANTGASSEPIGPLTVTQTATLAIAAFHALSDTVTTDVTDIYPKAKIDSGTFIAGDAAISRLVATIYPGTTLPTMTATLNSVGSWYSLAVAYLTIN